MVKKDGRISDKGSGEGEASRYDSEAVGSVLEEQMNTKHRSLQRGNDDVKRSKKTDKGFLSSVEEQRTERMWLRSAKKKRRVQQ